MRRASALVWGVGRLAVRSGESGRSRLIVDDRGGVAAGIVSCVGVMNVGEIEVSLRFMFNEYPRPERRALAARLR